MADTTKVENYLEWKFVYLNVKRLNTPEKHSLLLQNLFKHRAHIVFLQETNFQKDKVPKLSDYIFLFFINFLEVIFISIFFLLKFHVFKDHKRYLYSIINTVNEQYSKMINNTNNIR